MKESKTCSILLGIILLFYLSSITITRASEHQTNSNYLVTLQSPTPIQGGKFGSEIALSGNRLLVGETWAHVDEKNGAGKAYLYDTDWNLISTLTPTTPKQKGEFSSSLDIKDDILVVSSHRANIGDLPSAGEVQVYDSSGSPLYTLQSTQPTRDCKFGRRVAIGNGIILIGHCWATTPCSGTVAVYDLEQNYLTTLTGESMSSIAGEELAANEEYILIGGITQSGSVSIFDYDWNHLTTLQPPEPKQLTGYGGCISISGDHFVVGEPGATVDESEGAGRAYVYDTNWNLVTTLESPSPEADAEFGIDVCIIDDLVMVGEAKGDVTNGDEGKVYVFDLSGNLLDTIVSPEPETGSQFGFNVFTDGDLIVVSEVGATVEGVSKAGKIHIFRLGELAIEEPKPEEESNEAESESETESEKSGGIPGFPVDSVVVGLVFAVLMLWLIQRTR